MKIYGTGPSTQAASAEAKFNESKRKELTAEDVRFTRKAGTLYAFLMGSRRRSDVAPPAYLQIRTSAGLSGCVPYRTSAPFAALISAGREE